MTRRLPKQNTSDITTIEVLENERIYGKESYFWEKENRYKLSEVLKLVNENFKIDWYVHELGEISGHRKVNIHFLNKKSGTLSAQISLINRKELSEHDFSAHDGYLGYCQSDNGKIQVVFGYPAKVHSETSQGFRLAGEFEPKQITEDMIIRHIQSFLRDPLMDA